MRKRIAFLNTFCKSLFFLSEKTANLKNRNQKEINRSITYMVTWSGSVYSGFGYFAVAVRRVNWSDRVFLCRIRIVYWEILIYFAPFTIGCGGRKSQIEHFNIIAMAFRWSKLYLKLKFGFSACLRLLSFKLRQSASSLRLIPASSLFSCTFCATYIPISDFISEKFIGK